MLSSIQKNIIIMAVRIRINNGEKLEDVLVGYPKLTNEEKTTISKEFTPKEVGE